MAYRLIELGEGRTLQDTTTDIPYVVDAALERTAANPTHLAKELRIHYGVFPRLLERLIKLHGTYGERQLIADNLREENGDGVESNGHRVMYDRFLASLQAAHGRSERLPEIRTSIKQNTMAMASSAAMLAVMDTQPYSTAVASVYGLELRGPQQMEQLYNFFSTLGGAALDLEFFELHMEADQEHSRQFEGLLAAEIRMPKDLADAQRGIDIMVANDRQLWLSI